MLFALGGTSFVAPGFSALLLMSMRALPNDERGASHQLAIQGAKKIEMLSCVLRQQLAEAREVAIRSNSLVALQLLTCMLSKPGAFDSSNLFTAMQTHRTIETALALTLLHPKSSILHTDVATLLRVASGLEGFKKVIVKALQEDLFQKAMPVMWDVYMDVTGSKEKNERKVEIDKTILVKRSMSPERDQHK